MRLTRRSVVLLVVAALFALLNVWGARRDVAVEALPSVEGVLPDSVAIVQISTPIEKLRMERVSTEKGNPDFEHWRIVTPLDFPADAAQLRTVLRTFAPGLQMEAFVDDGNHEDYGVDGQNGKLVELFRAGEDVPAAAVIVGKTAAGPSCFVRLPGAENVYRADVGGRERYDRPAAEWRDKVASDVPAADVVALTLTRGAEVLRFAHGVSTSVDSDGNPTPGPWELSGGRFPVDVAAVDATIRAIARIRAGEVHNPDYEAGFDAPSAVAALQLSDGSVHTVTLGGRSDANAAFVRVTGRDEVFRVASNVGRVLTQPIESFRDRQLLTFAREDVASIAYVDSGLTVVIAQSDDGVTWTVTQPANMDVDQQLALYTLHTLSGLRAAAIPPNSRFDASGARFEVRFRDGRTTSLELGQSERDAGNRPLVRVRATGRDGVFQLRETTISELKRAFGRG